MRARAQGERPFRGEGGGEEEEDEEEMRITRRSAGRGGLVGRSVVRRKLSPRVESLW